MNLVLLRKKLREKHLNYMKVAQLLDVDPATFWRKRTGLNEFTRKEILTIRKALQLTDKELLEIFFTE